MPTYEEHRVALLPSWMRSDTDVAFQEVVGAEQDDLVDRAKQAVKVRFIGLCPDDALAGHGLDSQIERGPAETADQYRGRLLGRWETHPWRGVETSMLAAFELYGLASVKEYTRRDGWNDGNDYWWSRFWIVIDQTHPWEALIADGSLIASEEVLAGTTMTASELRTLRRIIRGVRCGSEIGVYILLVYSGVYAAPDLLADDGILAGCESVKLPIGIFAGGPLGEVAGEEKLAYPQL